MNRCKRCGKTNLSHPVHTCTPSEVLQEEGIRSKWEKKGCAVTFDKEKIKDDNILNTVTLDEN